MGDNLFSGAIYAHGGQNANARGRIRRLTERTGIERLTFREAEVLRLLATGLTNRQMAERLILSKRTVDAHLRSIYAKLGVKSRSAATRYAMENGIG